MPGLRRVFIFGRNEAGLKKAILSGSFLCEQFHDLCPPSFWFAARAQRVVVEQGVYCPFLVSTNNGTQIRLQKSFATTHTREVTSSTCVPHSTISLFRLKAIRLATAVFSCTWQSAASACLVFFSPNFVPRYKSTALIANKQIFEIAPTNA